MLNLQLAQLTTQGPSPRQYEMANRAEKILSNPDYKKVLIFTGYKHRGAFKYVLKEEIDQTPQKILDLPIQYKPVPNEVILSWRSSLKKLISQRQNATSSERLLIDRKIKLFQMVLNEK